MPSPVKPLLFTSRVVSAVRFPSCLGIGPVPTTSARKQGRVLLDDNPGGLSKLLLVDHGLRSSPTTQAGTHSPVSLFSLSKRDSSLLSPPSSSGMEPAPTANSRPTSSNREDRRCGSSTIDVAADVKTIGLGRAEASHTPRETFMALLAHEPTQSAAKFQ